MKDYQKFITVSDTAADMLDEIGKLVSRDFDWMIERLIRCAHEAIITDNKFSDYDPDPADVTFYKEAQDEALADFWLEGLKSRLPADYRKPHPETETL